MSMLVIEPTSGTDSSATEMWWVAITRAAGPGTTPFWPGTVSASSSFASSFIAVVKSYAGGAGALPGTDPEQAWFWTPEWQAGEAEATAQLAAGQSDFFESGEDLARAFRERRHRNGNL